MAFGLRYYAELQSKFKSSLWRVEIAERDYAGPSEEMRFEGSKPLEITWERRGDEFFVPIKASGVVFRVFTCRQAGASALFAKSARSAKS